MSNICDYRPMVNLSLRGINQRFDHIHRYLCYLASGGTAGVASDGLSVQGPSVVLGQTVAEAGNPAVLTSNREIPMPLDSFTLSFIESDFRGDSIVISMTSNGPVLEFNSSSTGTTTLRMNSVNVGETVNITNTQGLMNFSNSDTGFGMQLDTIAGNLQLDTVNLAIKTTASAQLTIGPGSAGAGTAPLKFTAGTNLSTPENGAMEFDGTNLYITIAGTRRTINVT